ncbi:MAG: YdbL family protein [Alphaproteobacteria bacterium]|nr:YdbL family protein [Alphaproteobacteria bacterium]
MNRLSNWITLRLLVPLLFGIIFYGGTVQAGELGSVIWSGTVGETARGYVIPVSSPSARVTRLVNSINAKRREKYQTLARKHNTPLQKVKSVVGKRLKQRAPEVAYVQDSSGSWYRK